jgi:hypothetical protein
MAEDVTLQGQGGKVASKKQSKRLKVQKPRCCKNEMKCGLGGLTSLLLWNSSYKGVMMSNFQKSPWRLSDRWLDGPNVFWRECSDFSIGSAVSRLSAIAGGERRTLE